MVEALLLSFQTYFGCDSLASLYYDLLANRLVPTWRQHVKTGISTTIATREQQASQQLRCFPREVESHLVGSSFSGCPICLKSFRGQPKFRCPLKNNNSLAQSQPFDLLVSPFWSIFSHGPKRLTFYFWVLWATETKTDAHIEITRGGPCDSSDVCFS